MRVLAVIALSLLPVAAAAQAPPAGRELNLSFDSGAVTLIARGVSVSEILAEWARKGTVRIIDGDKLLPTPVTYEFHNVPETVVLNSLLRTAAGYMVAPRRNGGPTGLSTFEQVFVLPVSKPTSNAAVTTMPQQQQMLAPNPVPISGSPDNDIPPVIPARKDEPASAPAAPAAGLSQPSVGSSGTSATPGVVIPPVKPGTPVAPGTIIK